MALRPSIPQYQHRGHRRTVEPAVEPVGIEEFRAYVKETADTLPDAEAARIIAMSRSQIEERTGLALIKQTWLLALDAWPGYAEPWWDGVQQMAISELSSGRPRLVTLPRYPLSGVQSVKTYDEAGNETLAAIQQIFDVDTVSFPGRLGLKFGQTWPLATRSMNAILIEYTAGFGELATDVPVAIRSAVLMLAGYYYEHQGECEMTQAFDKAGVSDVLGYYAVRWI